MSQSPDIAAGRLPAETLADHFSDLQKPFSYHEARIAADRCLFCYDAPCIKACPTGIDIPLFIRQIATGNSLGAAETILGANILGGACARVCPTETLCEEICVREVSEGKPIEIGRLQRHATDALMSSGRQIFKRGAPTGKKVAVIGAGPAGLSCAHRLALVGHEITIFEAKPKSGGLTEYGIAAYKVADEFARREVEFVLEIGGISVRHGMRLGRDMSLDQLCAEFDAVFIGTGLQDTNDLVLETTNSANSVEGVADAVDFIAALRQSEDLSALPIGRRVVVIGGGMTAIDMAVQAKRLGADEVTICYRRGGEQMNASHYEQDLAQTSGVVIRHWLMPKRLISVAGKLTGVELEKTSRVDGKLKGTGESLVLPCDQLFTAIGQNLVASDFGGSKNAIALKGNRIKVDGERRTSLKTVWAGGDCTEGGPDLTVAAVEDGKQAAISIDRYLTRAVIGGSVEGGADHG